MKFGIYVLSALELLAGKLEPFFPLLALPCGRGGGGMEERREREAQAEADLAACTLHPATKRTRYTKIVYIYRRRLFVWTRAEGAGG